MSKREARDSLQPDVLKDTSPVVRGAGDSNVALPTRLVSFLHTNKKRPGRPPQHPRMTSVSLSATDLADLGQVIAVGQAVLQKKSPVVARLKAAMTRMGVPLPVGL